MIFSNHLSSQPEPRGECILFLDIDGVLIVGEEIKFTPACVTQFKRLCQAVPELKIVLSSKWRLWVKGRQMLHIEFDRHALDFDRVAGLTPDLSNHINPDPGQLRGREIRSWLLRHHNERKKAESDVPIRYAIVDDKCDDIIGAHPPATIFATNPNHGLTARVADNLITYFHAGHRSEV